MSAGTGSPKQSEIDLASAIQPLSQPFRSYALVVLSLCSFLNYLDRSIINILGEPIKTDLHLKDWQLGMLTGLAFGLLYTVLGLPIGRWAERGHRPWIIGAALAVWSGFTTLCSVVQNYGQLLLARIGVGIGEAGCTPAAHSLIFDYVPSDRRSSALAMFGLGVPVGSLGGMAIGGLLANAYGWRTTFLLTGTPGLLLAIAIILTLPEPRLKYRLQALGTGSRVKPPSFAEMLKFVARKKAWWFIGLSYALSALVYSAVGPFIASFYFRNHARALADVAKATGIAIGVNLGPMGFLGGALGILGGIGGVLGTLGGGQLADLIGPKDPRRLCYLSAGAVLLYAVCLISSLMVDSVRVSLVLFSLQSFFITSIYGPIFAAWYSLVKPQMRATNSAILLFATTLAAYALGPLFVGLTSDFFAARVGPAEGLRWALVSIAPCALASSLFSLLASRTFLQDREG
jgi:MFS family permease